MKYLKYTLGLLALLLLIYLAIGLFIPSISYESAINVNKSINEAWAVMNDESKARDWLQGITKIEHISGVKGTVGAVTKYTFNQDGQVSEIYETMKEIQPNEFVAMDFAMKDVMTMQYSAKFSEQNGSTKIKSTTMVKGDGMIMRSMIPLMKSTMITQENLNMANLKNVIESNTDDYFAPEPNLEEL